MKKVVKSEHKNRDLGIASFSLSLASALILITIFFTNPATVPILSLIISIVAFIFAISQNKKHKFKLSKIGMIISLIVMVLSIAWLIFFFAYLVPLIQQNLAY